MVLGTAPIPDLNINNESMKSVKITNDNYILTLYEEPNYQGKT